MKYVTDAMKEYKKKSNDSKDLYNDFLSAIKDALPALDKANELFEKMQQDIWEQDESGYSHPEIAKQLDRFESAYNLLKRIK